MWVIYICERACNYINCIFFEQFWIIMNLLTVYRTGNYHIWTKGRAMRNNDFRGIPEKIISDMLTWVRIRNETVSTLKGWVPLRVNPFDWIGLLLNSINWKVTSHFISNIQKMSVGGDSDIWFIKYKSFSNFRLK